MWDVEVDIACIGTGVGALANAIAAVDAGGEVLVADGASPPSWDGSRVALRERVGSAPFWLTSDSVDVETIDYLAALTDGVPTSPPRITEVGVPLRGARNLSQDEAHGRTVEPFIGSRLNSWAAQCLSSSFGMLYSSISNRRTTPMRSSDGDAIEVAQIGVVGWSQDFGPENLRQWFTEQVRRRDIEVHVASTLNRIVFEDGGIAGIVLSTPDGPYAVRTRAGVTFAPREEETPFDVRSEAAPGGTKQVCLVGRSASRFGRVELLDTIPEKPARPTCTGSRRQYREGLHDPRQPYLEGWRCGKVQGYPPLD